MRNSEIKNQAQKLTRQSQQALAIAAGALAEEACRDNPVAAQACRLLCQILRYDREIEF